MKIVGRNKFELDTPCLVLDLDLLDENLQKMQATVAAAGKALRPHAKTHKCSLLAKMQLAAGAVGICAAKVSEAEALVQAGIPNVLITGPVATAEKIARLMSLLRTAPFLMTVVDHPASIELLEQQLAGAGLTLDVLVDLDIGHGRTGVAPGKAMELAERVLASDRLRLRGIQAYAGNVQHIPRYSDSPGGLAQGAEAGRGGLSPAAAPGGILHHLQRLRHGYRQDRSRDPGVDGIAGRLVRPDGCRIPGDRMRGRLRMCRLPAGADHAHHGGQCGPRPAGDGRRRAEGALQGRRAPAGPEPGVPQPAVRLVRR